MAVEVFTPTSQGAKLSLTQTNRSNCVPIVLLPLYLAFS